MKVSDIHTGVFYHNGKTGARSYSERLVLEMNVYHDYFGENITDGVRYKQTDGPYTGKVFVLPLKSFARWAVGIAEKEAGTRVEEEAREATIS